MDDPVKDWLQANKRFLFALVLGFFAIIGYREYLPKWQASGLTKSWDLYHSIRSGPPASFQGTALEETLARSRKDSRVHPWILLRAAGEALAGGDQDSIEIVSSELTSLKSLGGFPNVSFAPGEGSLWDLALTALAGEQVGGELKTPNHQDPEGATLSIQVQVGEGDDSNVFDLDFKLFEDAAPTGTSSLLAKAERGDWNDAQILEMGPFALRILLPGSKGAEPLPLERSFGCFHSAGTLGTLVDPSGARSHQKGGELLIHLEDAYSYDGRTTVLGRIADPASLDILREIADNAAAASEDGPKTVKVLSARRL